MTYVLGALEKSSPFGAHGRPGFAHEVRSALGEVSSPFGAHGRPGFAHEVRSALGGGLGYVRESDFGAHGVGPHLVRSTLGGLGDASALAMAKASQQVQIAEQSGNAASVNAARQQADAVAAAITAQKAYDAKATGMAAGLALLSPSARTAAIVKVLGPRPVIPTTSTVRVPIVPRKMPSLTTLPIPDKRPVDGGSGAPPTVIDTGAGGGGGSNTMLYVAGAAVVAVGIFLSRRS